VSALRCLPLAWGAAVFFAVSGYSWAASCGDGRARPAWVSQQLEQRDDAFYYAVGVSDASASSQSGRIASAKQQALKELAETIQVSVKSFLETTTSRVAGAGKPVLSESTLKGVTEISASASLQGAEVVETWEDPKTCNAWVRARVPRRLVEQKQRELAARQMLSMLQERLTLARDGNLSPAQREEAVSGGLALLERIDFESIPEAGSSIYFRQQLTAANDSIRGAVGDTENARLILKAVDQALQRAISARETEREAHYAEAARQLKLLQARHPNGLASLFAAQDIQFRLAEIEEMRGNGCAAKVAYGRLTSGTPRGDEAKRRAGRLACSPADLEKENWRAYFDGRPVQLHCYVIRGRAVTPWPKMCDSVVSYLGGIGTLATANSLALGPEDLIRLLNEGGAPPRASAAELPMFFLAQGEFKRRRDPDGGSSGGYEYQFEGTVGAVVYEGDKPGFTDRFQGVTGWNPVSDKMVEDVLALNVFKRWKDKFGQFLRK
jgi:hypothetical protein